MARHFYEKSTRDIHIGGGDKKFLIFNKNFLFPTAANFCISLFQELTNWRRNL